MQKEIEDLFTFYLEICPIDKAGAFSKEIFNYGLCERDFSFFKKSLWEIKESEIDQSLLNFYSQNYEVYKKLKEYKDFFEKNLGFPPFKLNLYWAQRVFKHESFTIIAPTGIGKTTFGIAISHFYPGKVYYLVPSKILLAEIERKLNLIKSNKKILVIKKPEDKEKLLSGDFDILVTTSHFLHKNFDNLPKNFELVFIDDSDSLIRQPKNIDKVLKLIGVTDEEINQALEIISKKRQAKNFEDYQKIDKLEIDPKTKGIVIAASATLTPKTKRINLFREILKFEIGSSSTYLRNIEEVYQLVSKDNLWLESIKWIKKLGDGGFVFLSDDYNKQDLENYLSLLKENGITAVSYEKFNSKNLKKFLDDEIQVVVGFSNIKNPLTRGIDLPQKVRYALFIGVPKFILSLKISFSPLQLFWISLTLREFLEEMEKNFINRHINFLKKISYLKEEEILANKILKERIEPLRNFLIEKINSAEILEKIKNHPRLVLEKRKEEFVLLISDPRGYLQASGRTSRLFPLGLTKGLALLLTENEKLLRHLEDKLKIIGYQTKFKEVKEVNLEEILKKIDEDREIVKRVFKGEEFVFKDPIETALVIVESPTKARTISNFFGRPARRIKRGVTIYEISLGNLHLNICATMGHFVDLVYSKGYYGVEVKDGNFYPIFQYIKICQNCGRHLDFSEDACPICGSNNIFTKRNIIEGLKEIAEEVNKIYLATDPDAEGEKIAYDLANFLYPYNQNLYRLELHEITKEEFLKRLKEPREINLNLVKAQLVRRIADRWVGLYLSEKIQNHFKNLNLSAGRVQTPILGWILERNKEIKNKIYFINVESEGGNFAFETTEKNKVQELKKLFKNNELKIKIKIEKTEEKKLSPPPPYETNSLLRDAFNFFKFSSQTTMNLAQDLFERGLITYHRTDSIYISELGRFLAREYLEKNNLLEIYQPRSWGSQGTHEGIRPTRVSDVNDLIEEMIISGRRELNANHLKLYGLIFNRFLASQVKEAQIMEALLKIKLLDLEKETKEVLKINQLGYLQFFKNIRTNEIKEGEFLVKKINIKRRPREFYYSQAELIETMKTRGLGRPSTYATFIQTLLERKYVLDKSGYLIPTSLGEKIYNYLKKKYNYYVDENFTRILEKNMDEIENGLLDYKKVLEEIFIKLFNKNATH
ncbi:Reverse gyrase [bacterium HR35]|nr:Reverse gyrase [bacterium HR35]